MPLPIAVDPNATRYLPGQSAGHYESFFLRANHPTEPRAFWIRYTIFSPLDHPENAVGELWAIYFDGNTDNHVAVRQEFPFAECAFDRTQLGVRIDAASLQPGQASGSAQYAEHTISWEMTFSGSADPLYLLPRSLYTGGFPKAKSLVPLPLALFKGTITVDGEPIRINNWLGSQNHNWGSQHTDFYVWGQVAGFESHADCFLEVATAKLKAKSIWTPPLTFIVLRYQGEEIKLNSLSQAVRAHALIAPLYWAFRSENARWRIEGIISAPREAFVGLIYLNPPGGNKVCLNSKIAKCELTITHKRSREREKLVSNRAAFELLSDSNSQNIPIAINPKKP